MGSNHLKIPSCIFFVGPSFVQDCNVWDSDGFGKIWRVESRNTDKDDLS